jgi:hypothetical protein
MPILSTLGRETISSVSTAIGFTAAKLTGNVQYALIQAIDGDIRFCVDGTTPTASKGMKLPEDSTVEIWGGLDLGKFLCIDDGGTAKLEVIYFGIP